MNDEEANVGETGDSVNAFDLKNRNSAET